MELFWIKYLLKINLRNLAIFHLFISFLFLYGCFPSTRLSNQNYAGFYKNNPSFFLNPKFTVFHFSDDSSRLFISINKEQLLYVRQDEQDNYKSNLKISYKLYPSYENNTILDSSSLLINEVPDTGIFKKYFPYQINFKAIKPSIALLKIELTDVNRNQSATYYITIDKSNKQSRQFFLVEHIDTNIPVFKNYFKINEYFTMKHWDSSNTKYHVRFYSRSFPIATPPFAFDNQKPFNYLADSLFLLERGKYDSIYLPKKGLYHFQTDTSNREGITLFNFYNDFPDLTEVQHLIDPLLYITSKKEFEELLNEKDQKLAVDKFWLTLGGNQTRAKELIRRFYSRVKDANIYFTSYHEGWKTDRGLIYIIYGPPNVVYRTLNSESWIYGEASNLLSLNFTFLKVSNPFSDNDYTLNRAPIYEGSWYRAVETWRQGRVYND